MKIVMTGAAGYAGSGIAKILSAEHWVRSLDIRAPESGAHESIVGDIADLGTCVHAVEGVDAVVLCHMAKGPEGYQTPAPAIDVNVKGTANMYHAMAARGIKRAVLISTTGVLRDPPAPAAVPGEGPYNLGQGPATKSLYSLTKIMQEIVSRHYFHADGIVTTILRPGWVVYDESLVTKYGQKADHFESGLIDPRDIGEAVSAALRLPDAGLEAFTLVQRDSPLDDPAAHERLGWTPRFRFEELRALSR